MRVFIFVKISGTKCISGQVLVLVLNHMQFQHYFTVTNKNILLSINKLHENVASYDKEARQRRQCSNSF